MRPFTGTISFADALACVTDAAVPIDRTETVPLADADGRVASAAVTATIDVPPFDRAAMDGYALRAADAGGPLTCVGRAFAGEVATRALAEGECMEIATGAPLPPGADAVVMVEQTTRDGLLVRIAAPIKPGQHIGRRGADLARGELAIGPGDVLTPARIGAVAALGVTTLTVFARPSVAILSTGNELAEPGAPLQPGQIYDVNRVTIGAVVARHGGVATHLPLTADNETALARSLAQAAGAHDILVSSGGSSVGDHDLLPDAVRQVGDVIFHGVAVKPGKPTLFGRIGRAAILGMPGNPTSCLSNAYMFLVPFLRRLAHLPPWTPRRVQAPLARTIASAAGRHQFYTVRLAGGRAEPAFKGSGEITSLAAADGYIEIPAAVDTVEAGTVVEIVLF